MEDNADTHITAPYTTLGALLLLPRSPKASHKVSFQSANVTNAKVTQSSLQFINLHLVGCNLRNFLRMNRN